jgi:enoyl-CoA hydratase/carnithine racemase
LVDQDIIFVIKDNIAWIRFNRPEKLNAINAPLIRELERAIIECEENVEIRVVILIGNEKAFIAGADVGPMAEADINAAIQLVELTNRMQERLADLSKPTIAAISGYALGAGLEVALCCDFRLAAENAVLGLPEITLGIIPGGGGTQRLPRLVNPAVAAKLILLGERINAEEAAKIGLVDKVVSLNCLEDEVREFAIKLIKMPSMAIRAAKRAIHMGLNTSLKEGLQIEQDLFCMLFGTEDQKEGIGAFLKKRKPVFKGR